MKRLPTYAFGYEFTHINESTRSDVGTLERENALYSDHWIKDLNDFRHVRISLTPDEAREYVRRTWAYELFLRAGGPEWARDVPRIDADVAKDADSYELPLKNGKVIPPPYHCFFAFMGKHLERIAMGAVPERSTVVELQGRESALFTAARAIQSLTATIRSFNSREKSLSAWTVTREDDIRDLLYVMLKPAMFDLVKEEPTPSLAGTYKFVDLASKISKIFIEVKWISRKGQWKKILGEIQIDIQSYSSHADCATLVFVVVDAARDFPDPRLAEREMTTRQKIGKRTVDVRLYIIDP